MLRVAGLRSLRGHAFGAMTGSRTVLQWSDDAGQASAEPYPPRAGRRQSPLLRFFVVRLSPRRAESLQYLASVQSLLRPAGLRLEVAPGLRPRLPIEDTQFVDISAPALETAAGTGWPCHLGGGDCAAVRCGIV